MTFLPKKVNQKPLKIKLAFLLAESLAVSVTDFDNDIIFEANKFRLKNKPKEFSTADCIGYAYALKSGLVFVTGDKEFKGLPNVEFV